MEDSSNILTGSNRVTGVGPVELPVMVAAKKLLVVCDGPWMVVQLRKHCITIFSRHWRTFKNGFGSLQTDFWLGLEAMHQLTTKQPHKVRFEMTDTKGIAYLAEYSSYKIGSEATNYRLYVAGYTGNATDEISSPSHSNFKINGRPFTTYDRDNDAWPNNETPILGNCAREGNGGFWYNSCSRVRINSPCPGQPRYNNLLSCMRWRSGDYPPLKYSRMAIMPNP